jgi:hypothetical protein
LLALLAAFLEDFADYTKIRKFADQVDDISPAECSARECAVGELPVGGSGR